jgi:uncharacterized protein
LKQENAQHLDRASELLEVAAENLEGKHPADSISRSYYAIFHAAKATLGELEIECGSHHAVWGAFGEHLVAKGLMPKKYHRHALDAFSARNLSDYLSDPRSTTEDALVTLQAAREFVDACWNFISERQDN